MKGQHPAITGRVPNGRPLFKRFKRSVGARCVPFGLQYRLLHCFVALSFHTYRAQDDGMAFWPAASGEDSAYNPSSVGMNVAHRTSIHVASTSKNPHLKPPTPPSPNNSFEDHKRSHRFGSTLSTLRATSVLIVVICLED
ncbi:hypothetical protein MJO29_004143 [Puccinia striiformis f. sp. tritici]|nr:hypothetical protein MJO29_004143 [Puccinia striiformis f. sp. tritici]